MDSTDSQDPSLHKDARPRSPSNENSSEDTSHDHEEELERYRNVLSTGGPKDGDKTTQATRELKLAPLIWWDVKNHLAKVSSPMQQYGVLGHALDEVESTKPILLNTNTPWSAFLCGSQGSGKSHALSCMLENCLLDNPVIGKNPNPLAGLVFHYDRTQGSDVCEAAYLCSSVPTRVLVSSSNYTNIKTRYEEMATRQGGAIDVQRLRLLPNKHLDTARIKTLMAVGKDGEMPLYMHGVLMLLRDMATKKNGDGNFSYKEFTEKLQDQAFMDRQSAPLVQRMCLLESFLDLPEEIPTPPPAWNQRRPNPPAVPKRWWELYREGDDYLIGQPGHLTIVDLTDPLVDTDWACVLFDTCLSVFVAQTDRNCSKIVALDEAHNYMSEESSAAVREFTEKMLKTIREQRHQRTRVVIATQEPSINTQLIDLCNITMVHRFSSPAWYAVLKQHLAGLFSIKKNKPDAGETRSIDEILFDTIVELNQGESLLFCPTAAIASVKGGNVEIAKMNSKFKKIKTRQRVTADGGRDRLADGSD